MHVRSDVTPTEFNGTDTQVNAYRISAQLTIRKIHFQNFCEIASKRIGESEEGILLESSSDVFSHI